MFRNDTDLPPQHYLSFAHPLYRVFAQKTQLERNPLALQIAGVLVGSCPLDAIGNPDRCAEHLSSPQAAHAVQAVVDAAVEDQVEPILDKAEAEANQVTACTNGMGKAADLRTELPDEPVEGPGGRLTRADHRRKLIENQEAAMWRETRDDFEHRYQARLGTRGHVVAGIVASMESLVTLRFFNVSLTNIHMQTFLPWLFATAILWAFNLWVASALGRARRDARERLSKRTRQQTAAANLVHNRGGLQHALPHGDGDSPGFTGSPASVGPSHDAVNSALRRRDLLMVLWSTPVVLLLIGIYSRLEQIAGRWLAKEFGIFVWIFPAVIAIAMLALLWSQVIEPLSRGNQLGDDVRAGQELDDATVREDARLVAEGRGLEVAAKKHTSNAAGQLVMADEAVDGLLHVAHRGFQLAASVLEVPQVQRIDQANLQRPSTKRQDRVRQVLTSEAERRAGYVKALDDAILPQLAAPSVSPHRLEAHELYHEPDERYVDNWCATGGYPDSTLQRQPSLGGAEGRTRRRRWFGR